MLPVFNDIAEKKGEMNMFLFVGIISGLILVFQNYIQNMRILGFETRPEASSCCL